MVTKVHGNPASPAGLSFPQQVNRQLEVLYGQLNSTTLPDFGSDMCLCSTDSIVATTVAHRFLGKFQEPDPKVASQLHEKCVADWLAAEEHFSTFNWANVPLSSKSVLYRARELLKTWLFPFAQSKSIIEFTPGETLVSANGRVSMYQKIRDKDLWTVTYDAFDDFARMVYNTRWLKKTAKTFFRPLSHKQYRMIYDCFKQTKHVGFAIFKHRLEHEVVTLVHGGRFASVEKNNEKRRAIIVAPLGNMLLQRTVAHPLREILKDLGNDLEIGQDVHKRRLTDPRISTVDFSNASDSNLLSVVVSQFPSNVSSLLKRYRDPMVLVGEDYVLPHKLSSMGCGFTFEIMTLLLLSVARVLDPSATVYGDDVIIDSSVARQFTKVMGDIMWKVNDKKTFIDSPFRESCGAFYHREYGYITCFDFHWCNNINDAMIAVNKLKIISDSNIPIVGGLFRSSYEALIRVAPALSIGPSVSTSEPDLGYMMADNAARIQRRSDRCHKVWSKHKGRITELVERFCWDPRDACIIEKPHFVNFQASKTERDAHETARIAYYLNTGMVSNDPIRHEGEWRTALYVCTPEGCVRLTASSAEEDRWKRLCEQQMFQTLRKFLIFYYSFCIRFGLNAHVGNTREGVA